MRERIDQILADHQLVFENDEVTIDLIDRISRAGLLDGDVESLVIAHLEKCIDLKECLLQKTIYNLENLHNSSETLKVLDREASRSNRYLSPLTAIKFKVISIRNETSLISSTIDKLIFSGGTVLRKTDYMGGLEGDTFLVILSNVDLNQGIMALKKLYSVFDSIIEPNKGILKLKASISLYQRWETYDLLLKRLDFGLMKCIKNGDEFQTV